MTRAFSVVALLALGFSTLADERDTLKVGVQPDGRIVVPTNQILDPAGTQVTFPGRPVDLILIDDGNTLAVKSMKDIVFIDVKTAKVKQTLTTGAKPIKEATTPKEAKGTGFSVVGLVAIKDKILATDVTNLRIAQKQANGEYAWSGAIALEKPAVGGSAHPAGIAIHDDDRVWVTSSRGNNVQLVNIAANKVEAVVAVGVAPYMPIKISDSRIYVSNWGGDHPDIVDPQLPTSGTRVKIDPRTNVANHGSVSVVEKTKDGWKQTKTIEVGGHPSGMTASKAAKFVYAANANSDTVNVIDTMAARVIETIDCKPEGKLPFGSGSNSVALSRDGRYLLVANGTNNCVAVVRLGGPNRETAAVEDSAPRNSVVIGLMPTGWYPGAIAISPVDGAILVANVKGHGSLSQPREKEKGKNSHDHLGSVSIIDSPTIEKVAQMTKKTNENNRLAYSLAGLEKPRADAKPIPIPERHGEPSAIEHVIYVIKENRTYDQVFGDMKEGNGDPKLCIFGEEITPNHHKLAREFTLFDNFYCSGVLSADGHSWVNEAYVTDYLEKAFGGFTRSYPYEGSDPLAFPTTGFLWDNALAYKKTFRNFGEHTKTAYEPKGTKWIDVYNDFLNGTNKVKITATPNLRSLDKYSHPHYPGFPLTTPDVYRAKLFMDELAQWEKTGTMPNLTYLFLPNNHTNGTNPNMPTPRAMVADNDLALGRVVEAVSKSKFWAKTCIFVVEDDPQNGFDHVDGHRTCALVISPYTKRKFIDSTCYNQTGMVKTIELILRLPPMTQLDLSATAMRNCFADKPDLTAYAHVPNKIKLDEMNKAIKELNGSALYWAKKSMELDFEAEDLADEDTFNRILWHAMRGDEPFPRDKR
jgi:DNA-binding beta-propeller fold protein YncE